MHRFVRLGVIVSMRDIHEPDWVAITDRLPIPDTGKEFQCICAGSARVYDHRTYETFPSGTYWVSEVSELSAVLSCSKVATTDVTHWRHQEIRLPNVLG